MKLVAQKRFSQFSIAGNANNQYLLAYLPFLEIGLHTVLLVLHLRKLNFTINLLL